MNLASKSLKKGRGRGLIFKFQILVLEMREATGDALAATEASTRAQILAWRRGSGPLTTPPAPLKLR